MKTEYTCKKTELYHHGIKGQQWGVRNGPPYPLDSGDHSASERVYLNKSKVSLKNFEENLKANFENEIDHLASVRNKLNSMADKFYWKDKKDIEIAADVIKSGTIDKIMMQKDMSDRDRKVALLNSLDVGLIDSPKAKELDSQWELYKSELDKLAKTLADSYSGLSIKSFLYGTKPITKESFDIIEDYDLAGTALHDILNSKLNDYSISYNGYPFKLNGADPYGDPSYYEYLNTYIARKYPKSSIVDNYVVVDWHGYTDDREDDWNNFVKKYNIDMS